MKIKYSKLVILNRIKEACNFKSDAELARFLEISPATLSNWRARSSIDYDLVFSKCEQLNLDWLLTGRGTKHLRKASSSENLPVIKQYDSERPMERLSSVPLYELQSNTNLASLFSNHPVPVDEIKLPNLPLCDGAIYMRGDTMSPELQSGDIVLYKQIKNLRKKNHIFFGQMYLLSFEVNSDEHIMVKYVHESEQEGFITLVSSNNRYPPIPVPLGSIKAMAMVKASVHYHTIS